MSTELATVKIDLGCGPYPLAGFEAVDALSFDGKVAHVVDLGTAPWPFADGSVSEANASHVLEHLTASERTCFVNELHRVLMPGGTCRIQSPHWSSARAYGDPTHVWPPVSEAWFSYLNAQWRALYAPHTDADHVTGGLACDFDVAWQPAFSEAVAVRHPEYQAFAATHYTNAIDDLVATLRKR